ncbi:MAG: ABC transporter ATP-binding protein [Devosia sp.]|nr:ABC transporter ATP-binding protein [Devosia sp.]
MNNHDHASAKSPLLDVRALGKTFPGVSEPVVADVSFTVEAGEIFALVGPSGCGKSTTLRMISGFETPDTGTICLDGADITSAEPEKRNIGIVFQDYALFPHLTVLDNVAFAIRDTDRKARRKAAIGYLDMVGLAGFGDRFPDQLSGGQQQRVALARTFAARPRLILLDEPFSNLDAALRHNTRREIRDLLKQNGVGAIFVTHDQEEALSFADRIAVMRRSRIEQIGAPEEVYVRPRSAFVARFLGRTNLIAGEADGDMANTALGRVALAEPAEGSVLLSIRPEHLVLESAEECNAVIDARDFKGRDVTYWVRIGTHQYQVDTEFLCAYRPGARVRLVLRAPAVVVDSDICAVDTDV